MMADSQQELMEIPSRDVCAAFSDEGKIALAYTEDGKAPHVVILAQKEGEWATEYEREVGSEGMTIAHARWIPDDRGIILECEWTRNSWVKRGLWRYNADLTGGTRMPGESGVSFSESGVLNARLVDGTFLISNSAGARILEKRLGAWGATVWLGDRYVCFVRTEPVFFAPAVDRVCVIDVSSGVVVKLPVWGQGLHLLGRVQQ